MFAHSERPAFKSSWRRS